MRRAARLMDERYKVAISRLGNRVRVAGSAEIGGAPAYKRPAAIQTLYKVLHDWFPGAAQLANTGAGVQEWKGARPMLPDGPPLLGATGMPGRLGQPGPWLQRLGAVVRQRARGRRPDGGPRARGRHRGPGHRAAGRLNRRPRRTIRPCNASLPDRAGRCSTSRPRGASSRPPPRTLPAHTLMQRAGLAVARLALAIAPHARTIWIACGPGNNGGDGLEAALHLQALGQGSAVVSWLGDEARLPADALASLQRARAGRRRARRASRRAAWRPGDRRAAGHRRHAARPKARWPTGSSACSTASRARCLPSTCRPGLDADTGHAATAVQRDATR